jgi:cellobiose phosphorylase
MYRLIVESLLGLAREKDRLRFTPCLPQHWEEIAIRYGFGATVYEIEIRQVRANAGERIGAAVVESDGVVQPDDSVLLVDDRAQHRVVVRVRVP